MSDSKEKIIDDIKKNILKSGGDFSCWYVGISKNAKETLLKQHKLKKDDFCICRSTDSYEAAKNIKDYFVNTLWTDGGGGGDDDTKMVYAYKKVVHTIP